MSLNILNGYHLIFDYTLVPIGSRYWITNAKVGSRYLTQFQNEDEEVRKIKVIFGISEDDIAEPGSIIIDFKGVRCKILVEDGQHNQLKKDITYKEFKSLMDRCSTWIIRNPYERFKSGTIQKIRQFYLEMQQAYMNRPETDWESVFFMPHSAFHKDYPIDWVTFFESYPGEHNGNVGNDVVWFPIWKRFCEYFFLDLSRHPDVSQSFLGDVHTQPYLYQMNMFFSELNLLNKITIVDIDELDSRTDLFINEIGKVRYEKIQKELIEDYTKDDSGKIRNAKEFKSFINESLDKFKDVNYTCLERYFKTSDIYRWEMFMYLLLLNGKLPEKKVI